MNKILLFSCVVAMLLSSVYGADISYKGVDGNVSSVRDIVEFFEGNGLAKEDSRTYNKYDTVWGIYLNDVETKQYISINVENDSSITVWLPEARTDFDADGVNRAVEYWDNLVKDIANESKYDCAEVFGWNEAMKDSIIEYNYGKIFNYAYIKRGCLKNEYKHSSIELRYDMFEGDDDTTRREANKAAVILYTGFAYKNGVVNEEGLFDRRYSPLKLYTE